MTGMTAMKTGSTGKSSFTQNLGGALFLKQGSTLSLAVQSDSDKAYTISSSSGFSATYVAQLGRVSFPYFKKTACRDAQLVRLCRLSSFV